MNCEWASALEGEEMEGPVISAEEEIMHQHRLVP